MKATLDIPDDLYQRVKARSAFEGRPFRSVAVELLQKWLETPPSVAKEPVSPDANAPWLAITRRTLRPGQRHELNSVRSSIAASWSAESEESSLIHDPAKRP